MAASVLTVAEQKSSLSGKKKKRKVIKNVLGLPKNLKIESFEIESNDAEGLSKILERLLPSARLPIQPNPRFKKVNETPLDEITIKEARHKRNQLSLGVNAVNKSIKKDLISAVLLAGDIQPRFLIHHLNLLCTDNKIPFLQMPGLRDITKNCLGFPCIAMGFKKEFSDFTEAVEKIKSISETRKVEKSEVEESSESDDELEQDPVEKEVEPEAPFSYLYRSSKKQRVFIPEEQSDKLPEKGEGDFIVLQKDDNEREANNVPQLGISSNLIRKQKSKLMDVLEYSESDDEDDFKPPKKKNKKDWVIDTVGKRRNFKYSPAHLMKVHSNPDRISKKQKKG